MGFLWVILLVFLAVAWPWYLGAWLAERFLNAADPSLTRSGVGWALEALYITGIGYFILARRHRRIRQDAEATAALWEWVDQSRLRPPFPSGERASIDEYQPVELMALAVWVLSNLPSLDEEQQLREMRKYLGFSRMGSRIRAALEQAWEGGHGYLTGWEVPPPAAPVDAPLPAKDQATHPTAPLTASPTSPWLPPTQRGASVAPSIEDELRMPPPTGRRYD